jgi:riboflavin kinase/FMN adenylyltransferase
VTVGTFDGLHRAHQLIIEELKVAARQRQSQSGLVTFEPSPQVVLHEEFPFILTPREEKQERLAQLGLDFVYLIRFDQVLRRTSAAVFLEEFVLKPLRPKLIMVGYDHRFGSDREGDTRLLAGLEAKYGFELQVLPEYRYNNIEVKSTGIRERLLLGAVRQAAELLGYRYRLSGRIVPGRGIGRNLGFATANIAVEPPEKLVPASGVYAAFARIDLRGQGDEGAGGQVPGSRVQEYKSSKVIPRLPCVVNIGFRPTFSGEHRTVEIHLLDFAGRELYDRVMTVELVDRLRPEIKFNSMDELKAQIAADIALARLILAENG